MADDRPCSSQPLERGRLKTKQAILFYSQMFNRVRVAKAGFLNTRDISSLGPCTEREYEKSAPLILWTGVTT